jgi:carbonic anhydrase
MCEINVIEQVRNVARTTLVADAWQRGQSLVLHGWIYGLEDGRLHDLQTSLIAGTELDQQIDQAVLAVQSRYLNGSKK